MDYEKKYKQLNTLISDLYPFMSEYCKEKVEGFFPELKESKDERIRKAICIYLDWLDGRNKDYQPKGEYTVRDMIAWLEKQGEQKPVEVDLEEEYDICKALAKLVGGSFSKRDFDIAMHFYELGKAQKGE